MWAACVASSEWAASLARGGSFSGYLWRAAGSGAPSFPGCPYATSQTCAEASISIRLKTGTASVSHLFSGGVSLTHFFVQTSFLSVLADVATADDVVLTVAVVHRVTELAARSAAFAV